MKIVSLGEVWLRLVPTGASLGGAPVNFAWYCRELGAESVLVSAVGGDSKGARVLRDVQKLSLSTDYVATLPNESTGVVTVTFNDSLRPSYDVLEEVAWDKIPSSPQLDALAASADAVCFGTLAQREETSRSTIRRFLELTRPDCLKLFDCNLRGSFYSRRLLDTSLHACDVFKVSSEELPAVCRQLELPSEPEAACRELLKRYNLKAVALTLGGDGSVLFTPKTVCRQHGFSEGALVSPVGASDCFNAVLCVGLLNKAEPCEINKAANMAAAWVCGSDEAATPLSSELLEDLRFKGIIK